MGDFPESLWTANNADFRDIGWASVYGEVALGGVASGKTQMGDGTLGWDNSRAARVSDYTLTDSTVAPDLTNYYVHGPTGRTEYYALGNESSTGFTYGGPGYEIPS